MDIDNWFRCQMLKHLILFTLIWTKFQIFLLHPRNTKHSVWRQRRGKIIIDRYLEEDTEEDSEKFDILGWWRTNSARYAVVSKMARDVLSKISLGDKDGSQGTEAESWYLKNFVYILDVMLSVRSKYQDNSSFLRVHVYIFQFFCSDLHILLLFLFDFFLRN